MKDKYSISGLSFRPFGLFEDDLEIDFNQKLRPYLVTQILQCCTRNKDGDVPDENFFWDFAISKRIECLLLIAMSGRTTGLSINFRCSNETCQEIMEIGITLDELSNLQHRSDENDPFVIQIGSAKFRIRRPTGYDQLELLKGSLPNEEAAIQTMIRLLLHDGDKGDSQQDFPMSYEWIETFDRAMDEFDPLINFSLTASCPHCGKEGYYTINLEELSLQELYRSQLNLLQTIHRFAVHYHWSEQQIFSIPPWRRFYYLALIEKEGIR